MKRPHQPERPPATADAMRGSIDSGKAGDKVDFPDPAAAPLGTDAEAGGTPPTRAEVALDERRQVRPAARWSDDGPTQRMALIGGWLLLMVLVLGFVLLNTDPRL